MIKRRQYIAIWIVGVVAAAQIGKLAALLSILRRDLDFSLTQAAWSVSSIEVGTASLGLVAGRFIPLWGSRRALLVGVMVLTTSCIGEALTDDGGYFITARLFEGIGYMLIVIAGPSLMALVAEERGERSALILWSTFVPVGFALGFTLSGIAATKLYWPTILLCWGGVSGLSLVPCAWLPSLSDIRSIPSRLPRDIVWLFSLGFAFYTMSTVGVLVLLPTYLASLYDVSSALAGAITGAASSAGMIGGIAAFVLTRHPNQTSVTKMSRRLLVLGTLIPSIMLFGVFPPSGFDRSIGTVWVVFFAIGLNGISGLVPALTFTRLPHIATRGKGSATDVVSANAVLAQCGAAGALVGPPLLGFVVGQYGWTLLSPAAALCSVMSLFCFFSAESQLHIENI